MAKAFKCDSCDRVFEGDPKSVYRTEHSGFEVVVGVARKITADEIAARAKERAGDPFASLYGDDDDLGPGADLCDRCLGDIVRSFQVIADPLVAGESR